MNKVDRPINKRVAIRVDLRPMRSPRWPKSAPPKGRATKPTRKVNRDRRVPTSGTDSGKKTLGKTSAAIVPYRKKSYHSMAVPAVLEKITGPMSWRDRVSSLTVAMASSISDHEGQGYDNLTQGSNFQCNSAGPFSSRAIAWLPNLRRHMHGGSPLPSTPEQDSCRPGPAQGK